MCNDLKQNLNKNIKMAKYHQEHLKKACIFCKTNIEKKRRDEESDKTNADIIE